MSLSDLNMDDFKLDVKPETNPCKGLVFRFSNTICITSHRGFMQRKELRLLKRRSCTGCEKCGWIEDYIYEELEQGDNKDFNLMRDLEHGKMYTPHFESSRDWESGHYEIDDMYMTEVV
ncbi:MAG: hypothetical protein DRQ46_09440 [Gammaproteobacteria bacterium]|nr:MAG: hypothetical protein DRQ46_09440 [Gammaproteobacteria bacterium]